jgi:hypothetical protein
VHTNKESCEKQVWRKSSTQTDRPSPFWARFDATFDLAASRAIYRPLAESHEGIHSSSTTMEQRREGHRSGEERVEMGPLTTTEDLSACKSKRTLIQLLTINSTRDLRANCIPLLEYPTYSYAIFRVRHALFHLYDFVDTLSKSVLEVSSKSPC